MPAPMTEMSGDYEHDPRLNPFAVITQTLDDLTTTLEAIVPAVAHLNARLEAVEARLEASDTERPRVYGEDV